MTFVGTGARKKKVETQAIHWGTFWYFLHNCMVKEKVEQPWSEK